MFPPKESNGQFLAIIHDKRPGIDTNRTSAAHCYVLAGRILFDVFALDVNLGKCHIDTGAAQADG